ncbi:MAG: hypothetical protein NWE89_16870 [Candidatus Bathyarchaeota archaeon]|nr:hypothetical protein [Candidatus Bathyarchaeota archaeon]
MVLKPEGVEAGARGGGHREVPVVQGDVWELVLFDSDIAAQ